MSPETFNAPEPEQLAELLPAYDFEAFIAKGGMGAVYKATQKSLDRAVAIKVLPREFGADPEFRQAFETEAKAMAKLNHPNLISVYDYGDIDGMPYIVMELVEGKSLYHSSWNKAIEPEQAVTIVEGILQGLGHAHEHGILHGDIKPANILLTAKAEPKIGDFGLARPADSEGTGIIMGTPGYAAPELTRSPESIGKSTDLFAVGVILHELLTGIRPDTNDGAPTQPFGDARLDAIWKKATDADLSRRYATAEEITADLGKWRSSPRLTTAGGQSPLAGAMKRHSALPAGGTSPDAQPKTLATAQPAAGPPRKPSPATSPPTVQVSTGSNWSVVKYALGAAVLIAAIFVGVKVMKQSSEDSDLAENQAKKKAFENRPNTGTTEEPADPEPEPEEPAEAPPVADNDPEPVEDPGPPPEEREPETTLEALERLKSDLAAGKREEFPPATKRRGEDDFLFIETPMSWYQALSFAEAHGGHLALAKSPEELSWISQIVPGETDIWLGAGRAGRNVWTLNDGTDWALDDTPRGVGPFASINQFGTLRAGKVDETKPFVIQWHRDGSNPATIKAILKHTSATLDTPNPIFPPGTESSSARHMAIIPLPMKRSEAEALATLAGGILAVPASANEASWLADELEPYDGSTGFWLGGQREGESWAWDSGETWDHTKWISDEAPAEGGDALVIVPNQGWTSADAAQPASGLIIEWSSDAP